MEVESYGDGFPNRSEYVDAYAPPQGPGMLLEDGPFTGVSPQNCDDATGGLRDDVCVQLAQHGQIDASGIEIEIEDTIVLLNGTVPSQDQKTLAGQVVAGITGVSQVQNRLEVAP